MTDHKNDVQATQEYLNMFKVPYFKPGDTVSGDEIETGLSNGVHNILKYVIDLAQYSGTDAVKALHGQMKAAIEFLEEQYHESPGFGEMLHAAMAGGLGNLLGENKEPRWKNSKIDMYGVNESLAKIRVAVALAAHGSGNGHHLEDAVKIVYQNMMTMYCPDLKTVLATMSHYGELGIATKYEEITRSVDNKTVFAVKCVNDPTGTMKEGDVLAPAGYEPIKMDTLFQVVEKTVMHGEEDDDEDGVKEDAPKSDVSEHENAEA